MKTKKAIFAVISAVIILIVIAAVCVFLIKESGNNTDSNIDIPDYIINTQAEPSNIQFYNQFNMEFSTEDGFYYTNSVGFIRFYDYAAQEDVIVCNKPNCKHEKWHDDTPAEQRCNAYLPLNGSGFVSNDKLYILSRNFELNTVSIVQSDLDRSNQVLITELDAETVYTFAVKDDILYLANTSPILAEGIDGTFGVSGSSSTWMYSVDLESGKATELTERKSGFSADMHIIGAKDDTLYVEYGYFENEYDGTNLDEAKHHNELYTYTIDSGEYKKIPFETDDKIEYAYVYSDKIVGINTADNSYEIIIMDIKSGEVKTIGVTASLDDYMQYIPGNIIYKAKDGCFVYNIERDSTEQISQNVVSEFYIHQDAGEYVFGARTDQRTNIGYPSLILKKDYYKGVQNYIELNFYYEEDEA